MSGGTRSRAAFALAVLVHLVVLYWPASAAGPAGLVPGTDKLVHAAVFAAVAWTGLRAGLPVRWLVAALLGHAVLSEVVQGTLLAERDGDPGDALADAAGVLAAVLASPGSAASPYHSRGGPGQAREHR